ncbi:MAG TPA: hypothetical protein VGG51_08285 [Candidatus Cybelea sp.]
MTKRQNDAYRRSLDTVALKRRNPHLSLTKAATSSGTTLTTIRKYVGSALDVRSGRFDVKPTDRLPRPMRMLTPAGEISVLTTSSRTASQIGHYNNAVRAFLITGDESSLQLFEGLSIRSDGKTYAFVTDRTTLNRLARAGAVHFLDIYASEPES